MTLDETLKDDLMEMLLPEKREKVSALIDNYHGRFFTGSIKKSEVALFSFLVASALKPGMAEKCANFIRDAFKLP